MTSVLDRSAAESDHSSGCGTLLPGGLGRVAPADRTHPGAAPAPVAPDGGTPGTAGLSGLALSLVLVASFMVVLDFSIVNVALPSIRQALGFGGDSVQWVVTAYAITFGGLLVLGGRIGDTFGRRSMFILGLAVFSAASLAAGLAGDAILLVTARGAGHRSPARGAGVALAHHRPHCPGATPHQGSRPLWRHRLDRVRGRAGPGWRTRAVHELALHLLGQRSHRRGCSPACPSPPQPGQAEESGPPAWTCAVES